MLWGETIFKIHIAFFKEPDGHREFAYSRNMEIRPKFNLYNFNSWSQFVSPFQKKSAEDVAKQIVQLKVAEVDNDQVQVNMLREKARSRSTNVTVENNRVMSIGLKTSDIKMRFFY